MFLVVKNNCHMQSSHSHHPLLKPKHQLKFANNPSTTINQLLFNKLIKMNFAQVL